MRISRLAPPRFRGFKGMAQVLAFNWPFYALAAAACVAGALAFFHPSSPAWLRWTAALSSGAAGFWIASSLLASHWVYDRSRLVSTAWIAELFPVPPRRWANIHAGFDESTAGLQDLFSGTEARVLDIYDPETTDQASIRRARRAASSAMPATRVSCASLPLADGELEAAFLIFAAHEIRERGSRERFFLEVRRALRPGGKVLLVEHLRDLPNFIAFGPGFVHFIPRREWVRLASAAGLRLAAELRETPFVRVFLLEKPA